MCLLASYSFLRISSEIESFDSDTVWGDIVGVAFALSKDLKEIEIEIRETRKGTEEELEKKCEKGTVRRKIYISLKVFFSLCFHFQKLLFFFFSFYSPFLHPGFYFGIGWFSKYNRSQESNSLWLSWHRYMSTQSEKKTARVFLKEATIGTVIRDGTTRPAQQGVLHTLIESRTFVSFASWFDFAFSWNVKRLLMRST